MGSVMEGLGSIPVIGWVVIFAISVLIFIIIMVHGIRFVLGNKTLSIGGRLDKKIDDVKKVMLDKAQDSLHDEQMRIELYRKSVTIDEHLNADLRKLVRKQDEKICSLLSSFSSSFYLSMGISEIIKGELNERIDYNNIREKLSGRERQEYLEDILSDIRDKYSTFLIHLLTQSDGCLHEYPQWEDIKQPTEELIKNWEEEVIRLLKNHIKEKIKIYADAINDFKTAEYKKSSIEIPIQKNKQYLQGLGGEEWSC